MRTCIRNTTDLPIDLVRAVIRHTMPPGVTGIDVEIKNCHVGHYGGYAYAGGSSYHRNNRKFVTLRIGTKPKPVCVSKLNGQPARTVWHPKWPFWLQPYQYGQHKGKKVLILDRTEMLVYLAAHELRHIWQSKATSRRGYCWGSRGRYSEVDTEAYAKRKLREWRRSS